MSGDAVAPTGVIEMYTTPTAACEAGLRCQMLPDENELCTILQDVQVQAINGKKSQKIPEGINIFDDVIPPMFFFGDKIEYIKRQIAKKMSEIHIETIHACLQ